jgi:hypothetical protein
LIGFFQFERQSDNGRNRTVIRTQLTTIVKPPTSPLVRFQGKAPFPASDRNPAPWVHPHSFGGSEAARINTLPGPSAYTKARNSLRKPQRPNTVYRKKPTPESQRCSGGIQWRSSSKVVFFAIIVILPPYHPSSRYSGTPDCQ